MKYLRCLSLALLLPLGALAQQQVIYTQYMFNGLAINPAYAGTGEALSITAMGRWQWVGLEGAPNTQTIAAHTPIEGKKIGVGLTVTRDEIAVTRQTGVYGSYAYRLAIGDGHLSMGLQGGFSTIKGSYDEAYTLNPDPTFQVQSTHFMPNIGAGLFYYNKTFYAGLSAPLLLESKVRSGGNEVYSQRRHYFLTVGKLFDLSHRVKIKPNVLLKSVPGTPVSVDYNVSVLFDDFAWFGVSYRRPESINFMTQLNVTERIGIGYAYDHVIESSLRTAAVASHEIMLNYRVNWGAQKELSPRYF